MNATNRISALQKYQVYCHEFRKNNVLYAVCLEIDCTTNMQAACA